ncbi:MAG TPA: ribosome small subunit-dependent GTPase A [Bacteroidia bacterium]|nr:ribosome small subunit-dependent GTPase A [Bacteroidia bacterium]
MKARVIKSTGSWYTVLNSNMDVVDCRMKGNIRLKGSRSTNPIAVGDLVDFEMEANTTHGIINAIEERKNYIIRKSINLSKKSHVLAANVDHAFIMATVSTPRTPYGFIDRMLVTAEAYSIPASIILNKSDTWNEKDLILAKEMIETYTKVGYEIQSMSSLNEQDVRQLKPFLKGKVSLLIGHSGTGKSTLINMLNHNLNIKTAAISEVHLQGKHTTTFAEMHPIEKDTFIIDSPGIREFGLIDMNKNELGHYFPEIRAKLNQCRFNNCLHLNEPGCAVKDAVGLEEIPFTRYRSYVSMIEGETEEEFD